MCVGKSPKEEEMDSYNKRKEEYEKQRRRSKIFERKERIYLLLDACICLPILDSILTNKKKQTKKSGMNKEKKKRREEEKEKKKKGKGKKLSLFLYLGLVYVTVSIPLLADTRQKPKPSLFHLNIYYTICYST